ncbi:DNA alkylation repair protein [Amphibacillus jilinensis]|uniref:DNA alkylation repair protein n=1 Tax=Amphibacillus jilinensis TaxID=1216008 RepID=UPI0002D7E19E|nr:DNA alkylation repair protein [Amphibacillus jilinensis]
MKIDQAVVDRKGARKASSIPEEVRTLLNQGKIESVNLTEWLAVNHIYLLEAVLPNIGLGHKLKSVISEMKKQKVESGMKAIRLTGELLYQAINEENEKKRKDTIGTLSNHQSDSVRCWASFMNKDPNITLAEKLAYIYPFAADHHFGVREIAWMAIREDLSIRLDKSIELLTEWAESSDENIRRFSIEAIRPRGVWAKHIEALKQEPSKALPILNLLKSDPSKYVQDSVGNWLNDASKSQPDFVIEICDIWSQESDTKATAKIIKKAKRTIMKKS